MANGVNGTPAIFINGERHLGARDVAGLREAMTRTLGGTVTPGSTT
jgi:hypothetical protein